MKNALYYGDNLKILREYFDPETVDLVYLDPPFNSQATYNILFREPSGEPSGAQIMAFGDCWNWGDEAEQAFQGLFKVAPEPVLEVTRALRSFLKRSPMMAYLTMMVPRLVELHRVLKPTGTLYLHCDPTASPYLRVILDGIFGGARLLNEIIWRRSGAKSHATTRFARAHDVILAYTKAGQATWHPQYVPLSDSYVGGFYRFVEEGTGRLYQLADVTNPNKDRPNLTYEWRGVTRTWRWTRNKMEAFDREGRLVYSRTGLPRFKRYLDDSKGAPATDVWADLPPIGAHDRERLGYPTQKPEALLERIIRASSNEGDLVLDPFCGCGTAIAAAQKMGRRWCGIDITHLAINLIKWRVGNVFGLKARTDYDVIGEPVDEAGARELFAQNRYQFQWWATALVGARPYQDKRKGADSGIDGYLYFRDEKGPEKRALVQVKGGHVSVKDVREFGHVIRREEAPIGILLTLEQPTVFMRKEALSLGRYASRFDGDLYPRLQVLTIGEVLGGDAPRLPATTDPFKRLPRHVVGGETYRLL